MSERGLCSAVFQDFVANIIAVVSFAKMRCVADILLCCQLFFKSLIIKLKTMKKKITMLMTAFILTCSISFANGISDEIPASVSSNFTRHFAHAKNVSWEKMDNYYKASFELNSTVLFAFYGNDKHFVGIAHNLTSDKLPLMLQADLKMNYPGYWITDLVEYSVNHMPGYSVTLENADQKITLKSDNLSRWDMSVKIRKS